MPVVCKTTRRNVIKKHEDTIQRREKLFADYLDTVGFNAEPVLMTYTDEDHINTILIQETKRTPEYKIYHHRQSSPSTLANSRYQDHRKTTKRFR